jgi:hypothetical protein
MPVEMVEGREKDVEADAGVEADADAEVDAKGCSGSAGANARAPPVRAGVRRVNDGMVVDWVMQRRQCSNNSFRHCALWVEPNPTFLIPSIYIPLCGTFYSGTRQSSTLFKLSSLCMASSGSQAQPKIQLERGYKGVGGGTEG